MVKKFGMIFSSFVLAALSFLPRIFGPDVIGNDYPYMVYEAVIYRFYTKMGIEPLWYPHISGGAPVSGLGGAQIYHFPAWLLSLMPGYWEGNPLTLFIIKTALLFWLAHYALYLFFKNDFQISPWPAFFLSALVVYSLRTLDAARFGTYLDSWVYYTIYSIFVYRVLVYGKGKIFLAISLYLFISSGYSPMVIYGMAGTLILTGIILFRERKVTYLPQLSGAILLGLALSAPVIALNVEAAKINHQRIAAPTLEWASQSPMTVYDLFANLFSPWAADVQSGFGATTALTVVLISFFIFCLFFRKVKIWAYGLIVILFFLYAFGEQNFIFPIVYKFIPGFQWIRVPGRFLNVGLTLLVFFWGLTWKDFKNDPLFLPSLRKSIFIALLVNLAFLCLVSTDHSIFAHGENLPQNMRSIWQNGLSTGWIIAGILFSISCIIYLRSIRFKKITVSTICIATLFQILTIMWFGTWYFPKDGLPSKSAFHDFQNAYHLPLFYSAPLYGDKELAEGTWGLASTEYFNFLNTLKKNSDCVLPIYRSVPWTVPTPYYFTDAWLCEKNKSDLENYRCTANMAGKVLVDGLPNCQTKSNDADLKTLNKNNKILNLGPGSVEISAITSRESIFVTPYPYSENSWKILVNDKIIDPIKVSGGLLGLSILSGNNKIKITYLPKLFVYSKPILFFAIFTLIISGYLAWLPRKNKYLVVVALIVISVLFWPIFQQEDGNVLLHNGYSDQLTYLLGP